MVIHQTRYNCCSAFTILEILIVISIVLLTTSVAVVSTRSYSQAQTLDAQTRVVTETLELAKKKAASGDKSACSSTLNGYEVSITSATTFNLNAACSAGDVLVQSYTIADKTAVTIVDYTSADTLFPPLVQAMTQNCIVLQDSRSESCRRIDISVIGTIDTQPGACSC